MRTFSIITITVFSLTYCFWAVCTGFTAETRSNWASEAYQKNCESVVFIQGDKEREYAADSDRVFNGIGTGIIIDERGYIITNHHVIKDIRKIHVTTYDQNEYIATLITKDADTDLAILKINVRSPLRPITFGRSHDLMPGESCIAIGHPMGYAFSLTDGRISAINREVGVNDTPLVYRQSIQTNTEINPGNSGGPLINVDGEMIGINVCMRQGAAGIAFAIPVDQVVDVAAKFFGDLVDQQITVGLKVSQNEPKDYGDLKRFIIRVESVESNSPAALAGIQRGDVLVGIGKYTLTNKLDFYRALLGLKANEEIAFSFLRNKEMLDVAVAVGSPKNAAFASVSGNISPKPAVVVPRTASNATLSKEEREAELDKQVWENLGIRYAPIPAQEYKRMFAKFTIIIEEGEDKDYSYGGVVVKSVRAGSPAEQAGLTEGDIIVGFDNNWAVTSSNDMWYIAVKAWTTTWQSKESVRADVIRDNMHYKTLIPLK